MLVGFVKSLACSAASLHVPSIARNHPHLRRHAVLLHQWFLGEVDLQGVICRQAHTQAARKEGGEGVLVVVEEQAVVRQRAAMTGHKQQGQQECTGRSESCRRGTACRGSLASTLLGTTITTWQKRAPYIQHCSSPHNSLTACTHGSHGLHITKSTSIQCTTQGESSCTAQGVFLQTYLMHRPICAMYNRYCRQGLLRRLMP